VETSVGDESLSVAPAARLVGLGAQQLLIEFANLLNHSLQFLIIRQTALHLGDLLFTEADLADALPGIADGEDRNGVTFAAVALGATGAVADDALEQRAAENVAGVREVRSKAVALADDRGVFHNY
jgi:hypothetical protein